MELSPGINAMQVEPAYVGWSEDDTAANVEQFMKVWDGVKNSGIFYEADWTLKVDADCVFLPWKLRPKLAEHSGEHAFIRNCNAWPGEPNFPTMYGAIEILSQSAAGAFIDRKDECRNLNVDGWSEDRFITNCLYQLGVNAMDDEFLVADGECTQSLAPPRERPPPSCWQDWVAAFHPFKDTGSWEACLDQAMSSQ